MKKIITAICFVLFFWMGSEQSACGRVHAEGKDIYILYDDSSSMIWDGDNEVDPYIERWADADYAVRALFACRDEDDHIYVSAMNKMDDYGVVEVEDMEDIEFISKTFYAHTPGESIAELRDKIDRNSSREKWVIILTDGRFQWGEGAVKGNEDNRLESELKEIGSKDNIDVVYIPIGDDSIRLPDPEELGVKQVTGSGNVLQQILDSNEVIYDRQKLSVSKQDHAVEIDAPLKELIVFIQAEGELEEGKLDRFRETFLERFTGMEAEKVTYITRDPDKKITYAKDEKVKEDIKEEMINMKAISGQMLRFTGTSGYVDKNHTFSYSDSAWNEENVVLYYQLDLGLEIEVRQDGRVLEKDQDVKEGRYEVRVYPINPVSGERVSTDAKLLEGITLTLNNDNYSWGDVVTGTAKLGESIHLETTAEGNGIGESKVSAEIDLEVAQKIYPLSVTFAETPESVDYDRMNLESIENGKADGWRIVVREDIEDEMKGEYPDGIRELALNKLEVRCEVRCPGAKRGEESPIQVDVRDVRDGGDVGRGEYYIYPYLADENDYNIYEGAVLCVTAYRTDAEEESLVTREQKIPLQAVSRSDFTAEIPEGEEYDWWDMVSGSAKIYLECAGEELPEGEYGKVTYNSLEGDQGRNAFEGWGEPLDWRYWFFYDGQEVQINKEAVYMRRGKPCKYTVAGTVNYKPVPLFVRRIVQVTEILILCILLWIIVLRISRRNFGVGYKVYLYLREEETGIMQEEVIKPRGKIRNLLWPWPLTLVLSDFCGRDKEKFPDMQIRKKGKELQIVNAETFRKLNYTVDRKNVSAVMIFPFDKAIEIEETSSLHYQLYFKKRRKTTI